MDNGKRQTGNGKREAGNDRFVLDTACQTRACDKMQHPLTFPVCRFIRGLLHLIGLFAKLMKIESSNDRCMTEFLGFGRSCIYFCAVVAD